MTRPIVFISYSQVDEKEKEQLLTHLGVLGNRIELWSEDQVGPGREIEPEMDQRISQTKVAILLVTANFLNSKSILQQQLPQLLQRRLAEELIILPIIAKSCAWKEASWLSELMVRPVNKQPVWRDGGSQADEELATIVSELADIIRQFSLSLVLSAVLSELESPYGTMYPNSKFYIERDMDRSCWQALSEDRPATLFIHAPRQMGKSSLIQRMLYRLKTESKRQTVFIDFQQIPEQYLRDEKHFLMEFCYLISEELRLPEAVQSYWQSSRTDLYKCTRYLVDYILPRVEGVLVLALDEVERLLRSPFRSNFFGMVRTWHNDRPRNPHLARLALLLSGSIEPYLLIDNPNQSPFNVAEWISLRDFTYAEVAELNYRHGSPLSSRWVGQLMDLVDGHPFLIRSALYQLAMGKLDWPALQARATEDNGPFGDYLNYYLVQILEEALLKQMMIDICRTGACQEDRSFHRLKGMGLVKKMGPKVTLRNNLYIRYFNDRLNS